METTIVKKPNGIAGFAFILVLGIVFLVIAISLNKPIPENYIETQAVITRIDEVLLPTYDKTDGIGPEDFEYHVFVEYSYDGKTYSDCEYGNYDSSMNKGDTVILYLNPDNPSQFMTDPSGNSIFVIISIVVIVVGIIGLGYSIVRKR